VAAPDLDSALDDLDDRVAGCRLCPRLVAWREQVARTPRRAFAGQAYWAQAVPGFGSGHAPLLIVGLAPAAHGANRTGRMFTGDRSADVLVAALYRAGLASQPFSTGRDDGLSLIGCRMTAIVHCAPPGNRPTPAERDRCRPYLEREIALIEPRAILALGALAWDGAIAALRSLGPVPRPKPGFGHGAEARIGGRWLVGAYHPSQQNTFTGRLTPAMLDAVLARAIARAAG
jgi:uracil-DNA glycosylase family 4